MNNYDYLDLLDKKLDDQQKKACCAEGNTIVSAGAGSGKTQVLATRFAWLVMSKNIPVEQILTLTFTNKAASEMYQRIYEILSFFAEHPETPAEEKQRAKKAVENFAESNIQTLDSYCGSVVRQVANRYGIRPDFSTGSADMAKEIENIAFPFIMENRNDTAIQLFAPPGNFQHAAKKLFTDTILNYTSIVDSAFFFEEKLEKQKDWLCNEWNSFFSCNEEGSFNTILANIINVAAELYPSKKDTPYFSELKKFLPLDKYEESNLLLNLPQPAKLTAENLESEETLASVSEFYSWLKSACFSQRLAGYTRDLQALFNKDSGLPFLINSKIAPVASYILELKNIRRLLELLDKLLVQVNTLKRSSGKLSFKDVSELALKALCEQEDLRLQEQKAYQAIMIDEFQDNNNKNRDLLFILNEQDESGNNKGKLFFVGDEKQSIYKFRGADVSVFKQLAKDLNVESLQMVYNYRSSKNLLKAFNQIFGGYVESNKNGSLKKVLPRDRINDSNPQFWVFPENPAEDFEAAFAENNAALKNPAVEEDSDKKEADENSTVGRDIPVHFCIYNSNVEPILKRLKKDGIEAESEKDAFISANDQEAYFIAHKILTLVGKTLPDGKRLQYKDIAILDRSRTNRKYLTRYLNRAGIQYTTDAQKNIFAEAPVNDIYNFLRLCVYPGDTLSFASFLRSPFVNLSEKSVEEIIARLNSDFTTELNISAAENKKYQAAIELQKEFTKFSLSHPLTQVITKLWYEYGYRYETMRNKTVSLYGEQYDLLFEIARQADENGYGLTWLVDQLSIEKDKETSALGDSSSIEDSDISYPMEERDAVKIMTIHKSKGLQFKVVFVLGCFKNPQTRPDLQQVFFDDEFGITVNLNGKKSNYFYLIQSEKEHKKNMAEFLRLIYVGITRAEHEAYITGSFSEPKETKSKDKKSDEDKQTASENCLQRILKFYYPEITGDSEFARGKTIFAKDDEILPEFDYNSIEPVYKTELIKSISAERKNNLNEKLEFISKAAGKYSKINENSVIKKEIIESRYISPSSLEKSDFSNTGTGEIYADKILFPDLTFLLEETSKKGFSANDFGTLAHSYIEAFANGIPVEKYIFPAQYKGQLTSIQLEKIAQTCRKMTEYFTRSACGSALKNSTWHKAEYKFLHSFNGKIIRGTMDLIIKNPDNSYLIVDYKTDEKIIPEKYYEQQKCYRLAASELFNVPTEKIKVCLFYLRYGKEIDITSFC